MKTNSDWSFITQEKALPTPALKENKMFHALTAAYAKNQELEVYTATENIMRREKELCELALKDLRQLAAGKEDEGTLQMLLHHYQGRLEVAAEKESKLKGLSEDSKKMNEEYRKKNQELAEVKRNLMESQAKLRELAKVTEKLSKKEEELRFIEGQLRGELEKNRREMLNGLYEIAAEFGEGESASPLGSRSSFLEKFSADSGTDEAEVGEAAHPASPAPAEPVPVQTAAAKAVVSPAANLPGQALFQAAPGTAAEKPSASRRIHALLERCMRLQVLEPSKTFCSKSLVKAPDGALLCEYFFPAKASREARQYIFNTIYTLRFLLESLENDPAIFPKRVELALGDLSSRLDHAQNIHLEASCKDLLNRESLGKILALGTAEKAQGLLDLCDKCVLRFESLGPKRAELIEHQFEALN